MSRPLGRYSSVAIALHWSIAFAVLSMIPMGLWMASAIERPDSQALAYRLFQVHKSVGFLILGLTFLRLGWRMAHRPPAMAATMKNWETFAAHATHAAFYALLVALPISGWVYVSTGWAAPSDQPLAVSTSWFGLFTVPPLPFIRDLAQDVRRALAHQSLGSHSILAWGAVALVVLHVGAALKHQLLDRDRVLNRMAPTFRHSAAQAIQGRHEHSPRWVDIATGVAFVIVLGMAGGIAAIPAPLAGARPAGPSAAIPIVDAPAVPGSATAWIIDSADSTITFSGVHAGKPFEGRFDDWNASVWFDPADLGGSRAFVTIKTGSARTGDATQEGSLEGQEWFDPATFPTARFEAQTFRSVGGDRFEAEGTLRIKGKALPVVLPFRFSQTAGVAIVDARLTLDRTAFDLGMASDPGASWVSKDIDLALHLAARSTRSPKGD